MKLLFEVGSTCVGGAERVVLRLATGVRRAHPDWQVDAVVLCEHGGLESEYQITFHHVWPGPAAYKDSGHWIVGLVRSHGYPVVHCIDSYHLTSAAAELCPNTAFIQNVFPNCRTSPFAPSREWLANQQNPYSAIVTEFIGNLYYLPKPGRPPHFLDSIPNGIDTDFWCPGTTERTLDVCWVARTDPEKGIGFALELAPLLCEDGTTFTMVTNEADGPQEQIRNLIMQIPTFRYYARLSPLELREIYRTHKLFIQTSTVEGMPATPMEAAACGCRPICFDVDGVAEVFRFHPHSLVNSLSMTPIRLRRRLHDTLAHEKRYHTYTATGYRPARDVVVKKYTVQRMVMAYLDLYEQLANIYSGVST